MREQERQQGAASTPAPAAAGAALVPEYLRHMVDASVTPMVLSDPRQPDNPLVFVNRAFRELSGYSDEELIGRNCRFLQGPGTDPADVAAIREAVGGGREVVQDLLNYRKDGTPFVNELHVRPIHDDEGELLYFFGSQVDLGRFRGEWDRLVSSEERYRSLFDTMDAGFCVLEMRYDAGGRPTDYRFVEVNPAFARQTGLEDAVGRWMTELAPGHEEFWFETYGAVDRDRRAIRFESEAAELGRHFDVHAYPVGRQDEHLVAVLFTDVTGRKRAEADLRALNETLEAQVAERTRELVEAGAALRQVQKMEAIGQLTGGVAHDFNNLLTIIRSAGEFLQRPDLAADRRRRYVDAIVDTADRAASLTGQLLAFARRQPLKAEAIDLDQRVDAVVQLIRPMMGSAVEMRVERCQPGPCMATADPSQFDTALVNLAVNARDAMGGAGLLRLTVRTADGLPAIRQHATRKGAFVAVEVADTGSGIAPDDLARIFEPFFTTKEQGKGTGLGLSQVFGFAKQSGGDVAVESSPEGTRFTLYLPAARADASVDRPKAPVERGRVPAGTCVLVVEDNAEVGRFSTELLHDLGFGTTWVENAEAALAKLAASPGEFDLVFSDVVMPGMNGVELGREIRRLYPGIPVVLASGYSSVLAEEGSHGMPLVRKPYSIETLSTVLAEVLAAG